MDKDTSTSVLLGLGIGAGMMYLMDPQWGNRRRSMIKGQATHAYHNAEDSAGKTARDMKNRAQGLVAEAKAAFTHEEVTDEVLVQRVRSTLGRVVSHPRSIRVDAQEGNVSLSGPILDNEVDDLMQAVFSVRGVRNVNNNLEVHDKRSDWPGLQGGFQPRPGMEPDLMQENWSPTTRVLAGAAGGALTLYGMGRRDALGTALSALGLGVFARGMTNLEMERLTGIGAGRRAVDFHKTINIHAPVEKVFEFWSNFENFPQFMHNVREVSVGSGESDKSHWRVAGPAGVTFEWDAEVTQYEPNRLIAWKSVEGSTVGHAGIIRFDANPDGSTRVDIRMSYNPPGGALGHALAFLLGSDPKHEMDADLARVKTYLETGNAPHDAAQPRPQHGESSGSGQDQTRLFSAGGNGSAHEEAETETLRG